MPLGDHSVASAYKRTHISDNRKGAAASIKGDLRRKGFVDSSEITDTSVDGRGN